MDSQTEKQKIFFPNLDAFRFFSFVIVLLSHAIISDSEEIRNTGWYTTLKKCINGELGVDFFFVLSGFLITFLLLKEKERRGKIDVFSFYIRRILRIWPLYYFCVLFGFLISPMMKEMVGRTAIESADPWLCSLFLNNFDRLINGVPDSSVLSILWSIAIEEQFYLVWPILFFFTPKKYSPLVFVGVIALSISYWLYCVSNNIPVSTAHTLISISDMGIGGLGAWWAIKTDGFKNMFGSLPRIITLLPYFIASLFFIKIELFYVPFLIMIHKQILAFAFLWIILEQNFNPKSYFKVSRLKICTSLGKYTYGLYCLHPIAISAVLIILRKMGWNQHGWQILVIQVPAALLLSIMISYISYHTFEKHFLKLKERFSYITQGTKA